VSTFERYTRTPDRGPDTLVRANPTAANSGPRREKKPLSRRQSGNRRDFGRAAVSRAGVGVAVGHTGEEHAAPGSVPGRTLSGSYVDLAVRLRLCSGHEAVTNSRFTDRFTVRPGLLKGQSEHIGVFPRS